MPSSKPQTFMTAKCFITPRPPARSEVSRKRAWAKTLKNEKKKKGLQTPQKNVTQKLKT